MRIAMDARVLALPEVRGIGGYVLELLRHWPEAGDEFVLLSEDAVPEGRVACPARVEYRRAASPPGTRVRVWDWWSAPRALRGERADLLWTPANLPLPVRGLPQAVTVHDTILQEKVAFADRLDDLYFNRVAPWWTRRYADGVVTVSGFSRGRIAEVFAYPRERVRVIHNGTSFAPASFADRAAAREHLRAAGLVDGPYLLALGAESAWKNTDGALRAFAVVAEEDPEVRFVVAGVQGGALERFAAMARELGLAERTRLLGFQDSAVRDALYQGAEAFLYASLFEGFGLPPLEAMALGTPVVASDAASIPEVVGDAALVVDAADAAAAGAALLSVLADPELAARLAERGRRNVGRFGWAASAARHREFFKELAGC